MENPFYPQHTQTTVAQVAPLLRAEQRRFFCLIPLLRHRRDWIRQLLAESCRIQYREPQTLQKSFPTLSLASLRRSSISEKLKLATVMKSLMTGTNLSPGSRMRLFW